MAYTSRIPETIRKIQEFGTQLALAMGRDVYIEALAQVPIETAALRDSMTLTTHEGVSLTDAEVRTHGSQAEHLTRLGRSIDGEDYSYALFVRDHMRSWMHAFGSYATLEDYQGFMEWAALATWDKLDALITTYAARTGLR